MPEPTLTDVFGANATSGAVLLTINKEDLASTGLIADEGNSAESLVVALVMKFANTLTETQRATDTGTRNVTVSYAGQDTINQLGTQYQRDVWNIVAYKQVPVSPVVPGSY